MRVGVLTGGGDCPGLNGVIRGVVQVGAIRFGHEHVGLLHGWRGLLEKEERPLGPADVADILEMGGTILRSSRTNPFKDEGGAEAAVAAFAELGLDALVAIGGEDTLGVARRLYEEHGLKTIGVPKTIDNDLSGTDYTFGFWSAVQIATENIDRLRTTARSHDRVMVVEVMGRHSGWIANEAGIATSADLTLIPEQPVTLEGVVAHVEKLLDGGRDYVMIVASEGVELGSDDEGEVDDFGHKQLAKVGVAEQIADAIKESTGHDTRATVLGHIQRGGSPIAYDRVLSTRFGVRAAELVEEGGFGRMVALRGDEIVDIPLSDAVSELKLVPDARYRVTSSFWT
jgi:phosphofructokinase-like protein